MGHQRILILSAYASWHYHTAIECTLAHALRLRGAAVTMLGCDGLFPACDIHRKNLNPRKPNSCELCRNVSSRTAKQFGEELHWLSRLVPEPLQACVRPWADALANHELRGARWKGRPVGEWALSSALYQHRRCHADWTDPDFVQTFREQLAGSVLAFEAALAAFDELKPDLLITLNGRFFAHRAAVEVARERGVRFVTHERGMQKNTLVWRDDELTHELEGEKSLWNSVADLPLESAQIDFVERVLHERRFGKGMSWSVRYSPPPEERRALKSKLSLDERPIVALFSSSEDEQATFPKWAEGAFPDGRDWLDATLEIARATPSHQFVIRMHPGLVSMGVNEAALRHARELAPRCPENCRVVMPKDDVSSYTLADAAELCIVYYSTMGLELAARGQRVLTVAAGWYAHAGFAHFVERKEDYAAAVRGALGQGRDMEIARRALRFAWQCFGVWSLPFPSVIEEPVSCGKPTYAHVRELKPGCDAALDRICAFLLEGTPLFAPANSAGGEGRLSLETRRITELLSAKDDSNSDAGSLIESAESIFQSGDAEQACQLLLRALERDPRSCRAWRDLGAIMHATGNLTDAIEAFEQALRIDPQDQAARDDLAAIQVASSRLV